MLSSLKTDGKDGGINPDMFKNLMNPRDPISSLKPFIKTGNIALVEPMLDKVDLLKFGGDVLTMACQAGKKEIV